MRISMNIDDFGPRTKYITWYFSIIEKHALEVREPYCEAHHIFPRFAFGENENLVLVKYRVHFLLHMLLAKHYRKNQSKLFSKAVYPLIRMKSNVKNQYSTVECRFTSRTFQTIKEFSIEALSGENNPFYGKTHSEEARKRISKGRKGTKMPDSAKLAISDAVRDRWKNDAEFKARMIDMFKNRIVSQETKDKLSKINTGRKLSEETKEKISRSKLGKKMKPKTDEARKNISEALKGYVKSKEHIDKINKNPEKIRKTAEKHRGMKRSEETKRRISESRKGKSSNRGRKTYYDPSTLEIFYFTVDDEIPADLIPGDPRLKRKRETENA